MKEEFNVRRVLAAAVFIIVQGSLFLLKTINAIKWSWLWVLAPLWIPYVIITLGIMAMFAYVIYCDIAGRIIRKKHDGRKLSDSEKP